MRYYELVDKVLENEEKLNQMESTINQLTSIDIKGMNEEEIEKATTSLYRYELALRSALRLAKRMGLPDQVEQAIILMQRVQRVVHLLEMTYHALMVAEAAAGNPMAWISWIQFGIYAGTTAVTMGDYMGA